MRRRAFLWGGVGAVVAGRAAGQQTQALELPPPVLTVDGERLFSGSAFGRRVAAEVEQAARDLAAENREIEAALRAEESDLTTRRATLAPEEFRALANAFDEKVQRIRAEQDDKERAITQMRDKGREELLGRIAPILSDIVRERGSLVVLDRRDVFLSADSIDITDEAIRRIDAAMGDEPGATSD